MSARGGTREGAGVGGEGAADVAAPVAMARGVLKRDAAGAAGVPVAHRAALPARCVSIFHLFLHRGVVGESIAWCLALTQCGVVPNDGDTERFSNHCRAEPLSDVWVVCGTKPTGTEAGHPPTSATVEFEPRDRLVKPHERYGTNASSPGFAPGPRRFLPRSAHAAATSVWMPPRLREPCL